MCLQCKRLEFVVEPNTTSQHNIPLQTHTRNLLVFAETCVKDTQRSGEIGLYWHLTTKATSISHAGRGRYIHLQLLHSWTLEQTARSGLKSNTAVKKPRTPRICRTDDGCGGKILPPEDFYCFRSSGESSIHICLCLLTAEAPCTPQTGKFILFMDFVKNIQTGTFSLLDA